MQSTRTPESDTPSHARLLERMRLHPVTGEPLPGGTFVDQGRLSRDEKQKISERSLRTPKPEWLKIKLPGGGRFSEVRQIVQTNSLHTICEEGHCPNIGECWSKGTATFQILGDTCTRACRYCAVATGIPGTPADLAEPARVASAIRQMGVLHAVITSVDRDDLPDRGAGQFVRVINAIHRASPGTGVEVLTPDFMGREEESLQEVIGAHPDVFAHNTETVPRLYRRIRPKGNFDRAMFVLRRAKEIAVDNGTPDILTKSGVIAGMGESNEEIIEVMKVLRENGVDVVTIGQYLRPTKKHLPVDRFVHPDEFAELAQVGMEMGFGNVFAGPLVRSSYRADEQRQAALQPAWATERS